jgi:hypothetical protein
MPRKKTNEENYFDIVKLSNIVENYCNEKNYRLVKNKIKSKNKKMMKEIFEHLKPKTINDLHSILITLDNFGKGVTLEKMIFCYGTVEGTKRFDLYRKKQSIKNTYDYKNKKYGWNEEKFKKYNKSRSITLDTMILKYGEKNGTLKYEDYCKKQAFTNSIEYLGEERYFKINKLKGHSYETYLKRYGSHEKALENLEIFWQKQSKNYFSKNSQKLFVELCNRFDFFGERIYYASLTGEYGIYSQIFKKFFKYDFVSLDLKLAIEFHGDHYHGNPKIYGPNDFLRGRGQTNIKAKEKWICDDIKINALLEERKIHTIVVWEKEYIENNENVIRRIGEYVNENIIQR